MSKKSSDLADTKSKMRSSGPIIEKKKSNTHMSSSAAAVSGGQEDDSDRDSGSDEELHEQESDSDADDSPTKKSKSSASATELAEKNDLATYLSSPSTYVSSNPQLSLTREELSEREEVEDLLNRLKQNQKDLFDRRLKNQKDLEGMRGNLKKIRKDTDELMKSQQTNLATMGRKLH